jgi:hypothetical protein
MMPSKFELWSEIFKEAKEAAEKETDAWYTHKVVEKVYLISKPALKNFSISKTQGSHPSNFNMKMN